MCFSVTIYKWETTFAEAHQSVWCLEKSVFCRAYFVRLKDKILFFSNDAFKFKYEKSLFGGKPNHFEDRGNFEATNYNEIPKFATLEDLLLLFHDIGRS